MDDNSVISFQYKLGICTYFDGSLLSSQFCVIPMPLSMMLEEQELSSINHTHYK
jgi:hypothetical protein